MSASTFGTSRPTTCTPGHAARELGLKRGEFDIAVHLGHIRTVPDEGGGGGRRVEREEIDRLRAREGHPETLLERVRVVGTAEGAALMGIPAGRFTRLARLGLIVPAKWYLNRYRAVVWLYLAEDLRSFASAGENGRLLTGRTPETLRGQLAAGVDLRPRNWRGRHLGFLLRQAEEPWARVAVMAAFLAAVDIADVVRDPYDRAFLHRFRPPLPGQGAPGTTASHLTERITIAQDADEIAWLRSELAHLLEEARAAAPAPRPAVRHPRPALRAAAHPIPPLARTVTHPVEPAAPPASESGEAPVTRVPEPSGAPAVGMPGPDGEPAAGAPARSRRPRERPCGAPANRRPPHRAEQDSTRPDRGLRSWLRRRGARPARP